MYGDYYWIDERHIGLNLVLPGPGGYFENWNGVVVEILLENNLLNWSSPEYFWYGTHTFRKIHDFTVENQNSCPGALPSHVVKDFWGFVTFTDGSSGRLRTQPSLDAGVVASASEGRWFYTIGGPICADGYTWWQVELKDTYEIGWMAEGGDQYFIDLLPFSTVNLPTISPGWSQSGAVASDNYCPGAPPPHMILDSWGRVTFTNGSPTNLRSGPASASILMAMPEGYEFEVLGGPECHNSLNWWQLRTPDGLVGWAPEGTDGAEYWIEPLPSQPGDAPPQTSPDIDNSQNQPYVGMRFVWYDLDHAPMIGVRAWPTAETALQDVDAGYIETTEGFIQMSGTIDTLAWDFPAFISVRDFTGGYHVLEGPVCNETQCAWLVTLYDGSGWILWHEDFREWRYGEPPWQEGDALTVNAEPFSRIPIFYGDPVPGTDVGMLDNGTVVSVVEGPVTNAGWYSQWFELQAPVAPDPSVYGYRWWSVRLPNGTTGYVPEGLPMAEPWIQRIENSSRLFVGANEPYTEQYARVPAVIHPDHWVAYAQPGSTEAVGKVTPATYYQLVDAKDEWSLIATPSNEQFWVPAWILQVGTLIETTELNVDEILNNPASVATIYNYDQIPDRFHEPRDYLIDELGRDTGNAMNYGYFAYEVFTSRVETHSLLCTPIDLLSDYSDIEQLAFIDVACVAYDIARGAFVAVRGGSPLGLYLTGSELILNNLGPFIRWNDRVWMDDMNRFFSSCPLTRLFWGEEAGDYCSGFMR